MKNKAVKKDKHSKYKEIVIYDPSNKTNILRIGKELPRTYFTSCGRCDVCDVYSDSLIDCYAKICQRCRDIHTDTILLKRISELIKDNKKPSMRNFRRFRDPRSKMPKPRPHITCPHITC